MSHLRKEYLTGVKRIDSQHEALFALIHDFQDAWMKSRSKTDALLFLDEILLYAKFHFFSEEHLMQSIGYSGLEDQRKEHVEMLKSISTFIETAKNANAKSAEIEGFLFDWFLDHISAEDFKFAELFSAMKTGSD
jgi:hemerythrin